MLHATERQTRIGSDHSIDEDTAGFKFIDKPSALGVVIRPGGGAKPKRRGVGELDRFIYAADPKQRGHGAKDFIRVGRRVSRNVDQYCRFIEITSRQVTACLKLVAAGEDFCTGCD